MKSPLDDSTCIKEDEKSSIGWADFSNSVNFSQPVITDTAGTTSVVNSTQNPGLSVDTFGTDNADWQNFNDVEEIPTTKSHQLSKLSKEVMRSCFETNSKVCEFESNRCIFCDHRLYERRVRSSGYAVTCPLIQLALHKIIDSHSFTGKARQLHLDLPAECNGFDWDSDNTPNRDSISPILFRPGPQESPIDVNFDHERATLGLAILDEEELKVMSQEMEKKFSHLSELLVLDLQTRDKLVTELTVKNKFITAILRVKSLKHSSTTNSGLDGTGRPRSKSVRNKQTDERLSGKYLSSIIPFCPPEGNSWSVSTLLTLIEILNAIADGSEEVPTLVSDYLTKEIFR